MLRLHNPQLGQQALADYDRISALELPSAAIGWTVVMSWNVVIVRGGGDRILIKSPPCEGSGGGRR